MQFQGKDRIVPHKSERAQRWYPAEDTQTPKKVRVSGLHFRLECYPMRNPDSSFYRLANLSTQPNPAHLSSLAQS